MEVLELYKQGKSINEVAKITGVHRSSVYRWVKKAGITRSMSEASKGKILSESHKKRIGESVINSEKHKKAMLDKRKVLKKGHEKPTKEFAYVVGVIYGDGFIHSRGIGLESIDKEFVDEFERCMSQFGIEARRYTNKPRPMTDPRNGKIYQTKKRYLVRFGSIAIRDFFKEIVNKNIVNKKWILNLSQELKVHVLRGLWDSDGCHSRGSQQVFFYNKNENIIKLYEELLFEVTKIKGRYYKQSYNGVFKYYFGRQIQIKKFFEIVKPTIKRKVINTSYSN